MAYSIKPGLRCYICKHEQTTYLRNPSRYAGHWRKFTTTRSLHFDKPVLCVGNTYYFVDGDWMMRIALKSYFSEHKPHEGAARLPQVKLKPKRDYRPKQRIRRDSEKSEIRKAQENMTIDELQKICQDAKDSGIPGGSEVKLFNRDAPEMCHIISPVADAQFRKVQCYGLDGKDYRNKYLLLASTRLDGIGVS